MTQLFLIASSLAAAFAEVSIDELPAPAVDVLADSENDFAETSRRMVGPPSTWSVRHWSQGHIRSQNHPECPRDMPYGGSCSSSQSGLECYYEETCCPDHKRCTARKIASCRTIYGPHPNMHSWSVSNYGQRYHQRGGKCYLGHASSDGRRRVEEVELRGEMPEMAIQTDSDGIQEDSFSSRRLIGPSYTWPVQQWTPNHGDCPYDIPSDGSWGNNDQRGLTCNYERVCCPDGKRCVAHKQSTCTMMLPSGCKWSTNYYGARHWSHGVCHLVHSSDDGPVPAPTPYNPVVFG